METRQAIAGILALILTVPAITAKSDSDAAFKQKLPKDKRIVHALNRLTFGATDDAVEQVRQRGVEKWIDDQLNPTRIKEDPKLEGRLASLESIHLSSKDLLRKYPPRRLTKRPAPGEPQAVERRTPNPRMVVARDLQAAKLYRAIYSNRQLSEVLTDFWFNHFNVYLDKGADRFLTTSYERDAIRPHVLGNFREMLKASAEHPAMLWYLDNWQSVPPEAQVRRPMAPRRMRGLNENYARELLELHTLGVDGGYTQKDIIEIARCFTGWTIREPYSKAEFFFNERVHDNGLKVVLGTPIPAGGGKDDGLKVLDILVKHQSTGKFISKKLAQRFVADEPPEALVAAMAETFRRSNGDLHAVMRTLLRSREFWSEGSYRAKIKTPLELAVSAIRVTGADVQSPFPLALKIAELGQPLYRKQEPTGYSNTSGEWVNSAGLLGRMNLALALTQNQLPGVRVPPQALEGEPAGMAKRLLLGDPSAHTREALDRAAAEGKSADVMAALVLGSPEFQRR